MVVHLAFRVALLGIYLLRPRYGTMVLMRVRQDRAHKGLESSTVITSKMCLAERLPRPHARNALPYIHFPHPPSQQHVVRPTELPKSLWLQDAQHHWLRTSSLSSTHPGPGFYTISMASGGADSLEALHTPTDGLRLVGCRCFFRVTARQGAYLQMKSGPRGLTRACFRKTYCPAFLRPSLFDH